MRILVILAVLFAIYLTPAEAQTFRGYSSKELEKAVGIYVTYTLDQSLTPVNLRKAWILAHTMWRYYNIDPLDFLVNPDKYAAERRDLKNTRGI